MIEIVAVFLWARHIGRVVEAKGHRPARYRWLTAGLWFGGEIVGAFVGLGVVGQSQDLVTLYFFALLGAVTGAAVAWVIARSLYPIAATARADWQPTHVVPGGGMQAWSAPDPAQPPVLVLPEGLELVLEQRLGAWAMVRAANGWQGWVDGRLLRERAPARS